MGESDQERLIRAYALDKIVEAVRSADAPSFIELMEKSNLCRPLRDIPAECAAGAAYVEAGRIWSPLVTPNLRSTTVLDDWFRSYHDKNSAELALFSSNAETKEKVLFLVFVLAEERSPATLLPANAIAVWALPGHPSLIQQVWWLDTNDNFVASVLTGETGETVSGPYRNILFCDADLLSGCP